MHCAVQLKPEALDDPPQCSLCGLLSSSSSLSSSGREGWAAGCDRQRRLGDRTVPACTLPPPFDFKAWISMPSIFLHVGAGPPHQYMQRKYISTIHHKYGQLRYAPHVHQLKSHMLCSPGNINDSTSPRAIIQVFMQSGSHRLL